MTSQHPSLRPIRFGPYTARRVLGVGGMGKVYLAEHDESGRQVAVKTVRYTDEAGRATAMRALTRETRSLLRLDHPGIVRLEDFDLDDERPWFAMELLYGSALLDYYADPNVTETAATRAVGADDQPWTMAITRASLHEVPNSGLVDLGSAPVNLVRTIDSLADGARTLLGALLQVCHVLEYLHGQGVVHCDLKPENIVVTDEGRVVLVDFGIAGELEARISRFGLADAGITAGTAAYMAPERILAERFDGRADMYALGCMMYEALSGKRPFTGEMLAVLHKHLWREPQPLQRLNPLVPPELVDLVARLMDKSPRSRLGHAAVVQDVLQRVGLQMPDLAVELPAPTPYLYRSSIVGRDDVLATLSERIQRVRDGAAAWVVLVGDPGVGKSSVAARALSDARDLRSVVSQCGTHAVAGSVGSPLHALQGLFDAMFERSQHRGDPLPASAIWLAPFAPRLGAGREVPTITVGAVARRQIVDAVVDGLHYVADDQPMLLVIDQLQWADELSIQVLRAVMARLNRTLVLGLCRDVPSPLRAVLNAGISEEIAIGPLDPGSVDAAIGEMLGGSDPPTALSSAIFERTKGNPFQVGELMRLAQRKGLFALQADGRWSVTSASAVDALPTPRTMAEVASWRLDELSDDARACAEAFAVLGRVAATNIMAHMLSLTQRDDARAVAELVAHEIVDDGGEPQSVAFEHAVIREQLYNAMSPSRRAELHAAAAQAIVELGANDASLGWHFEQSRQFGPALQAYRQAAVVAHEQAAYEHAGAMCDAARRVAESLDDSVAVMAAMEDRIRLSLEGLRDFGATLQVADELATRAAAAGDGRMQAVALREVAHATREQGRTDEALETARLAITLARESGDWQTEANAEVVIGSCHRQTANFDAAREAYERAREILEAKHDVRSLGRLYNTLGLLDQQSGNMDGALTWFERTLAAVQEDGDPVRESITLLNLCGIHADVGSYAPAVEYYEKSQRIQREVLQSERASMNYGLLLLFLGRVQRARVELENAARETAEIGEGPKAALARAHLGAVDKVVGDYESAYDRYCEVVSQLEDANIPLVMAHTLIGLAETLVSWGRADEAEAVGERTRELAESIGAQAVQARAVTQVAAACRMKGDLVGAETSINVARSVANRCGNRPAIGDVDLERGRIYRAQGRHEEARNALAAALAEFERQPRPRGQILALTELGMNAVDAGEPAQQWLAIARLLDAQSEFGPRSATRRAVEELGHRAGVASS